MILPLWNRAHAALHDARRAARPKPTRIHACISPQVVMSALFAAALVGVLLTARPGEPLSLIIGVWGLVGFVGGPVMGPLPIEHGAEARAAAPCGTPPLSAAALAATNCFLSPEIHLAPSPPASALCFRRAHASPCAPVRPRPCAQKTIGR